MALHQLHTELTCNELLFWGKIQGIKADYFVAMGVTYENQFEFPQKKFFYAMSTDFEFKTMPDLNDQHKEYINRDKSYFTGEPLRKLK